MNADPYAALLRAATDLEAGGFSGILRATRGDEVLYESCHGFANRADSIPIRSTTRFATASLSKMFTAVGILEAGGRIADAIVTRVFEPAGMTASGYPAFDEVYPDVATGYLPPLTPDGPWRTNIYSVHVVGGGDAGVATVCRYLPSTDTTGVLLASIGWDDLEGMGELWSLLAKAALDG